jgi:hypothetical protein
MIKLRNILSEGRWDSYVRKLSMPIINAFKKGNEYNETFIINGKNKEQITAELIVELDVNKTQKYPFDINASFGPEDDDPTWQTLEINISYNPNFFPMAMNDFVADIKSTLRHELEHAGQDNFTGKKITYREYDPKKNFTKYVLQSNEVPAYVHGFYTKAKAKKISVQQVMDEWFKQMGHNFQKKSDWPLVRKTWINWGVKQGLVDEGTILNNPSATYSRKAKKEKFNIKKLGIK